VAAVALAATGSVGAAGHKEVDVADLRPGLVATYADPARLVPVEVIQLDPTIALAFKHGEAPHPRLRADGGTVRWDGYINILRQGKYRFSVRLRGQFRLRVAGKEVLAAEVNEATPALQEGPETRLEAGVQPLSAEFDRLPGSGLLELLWQSPSFDREPLPYDVLGHLPAEAPARLAADQLAERGRLLAEERNCTRCHQPAAGDKMAKGLATRQGPDLSQVGRRVYAGWLFRWLEAPQSIRPGAVMPAMFGDEAVGRPERYAVAHYLASLGDPRKPSPTRLNPRDLETSVKRGQRLFASTGCIACHGQEHGKRHKEKEVTERVLVPVEGLGSKTTPERLAAYLANPLAVDPSGHMPTMLLGADEALDLARFLCRSRDSAIDIGLPAAPGKDKLFAAFQGVESRQSELAAFQRLPADAQWNTLGQRLVIDKGCNNCHTIEPGGKAFASVVAGTTFEQVKRPAAQRQGCLAEAMRKRGQAPWFALEPGDRQALRAFLREGTTGAGSPAPLHAGRVALGRFNCLACHSREGTGGLSAAVIAELRGFEKVDNAEAITPPPLTGVGHKLRTPWLRQVLTRAGRARPWMGLRMPQFGEANVGTLPEVLAALEGIEPEGGVHQVALTPAKLAAGRQLVGKEALGCVSCHDIAGIANTGTRGPDLAFVNQRVRYDWYRRWLAQAQRMQPGTRMPTIFTGGKSLLTTVLGGSAEAQSEAMWAYLSLGSNLPLPEGLEPPRGLVVTVKDRPVIVRSFMDGAGTHAISIGYPGGVSTTFDASACRLAYAWSGNFLDASPVWDDRGGRPAKVLGRRFWTAPAGCPLALTATSEPPDFAARARDPAYGATLPEGELYKGPRQVRYKGYSLDKKGLPTFRYVVEAAEPHALEVAERPMPLSDAVAAGLGRRFALNIPARASAWLLAGECAAEPRLLGPKGEAVSADLKGGTALLSAKERFLVLPQGGEQVVIVTLAGAPEGAEWRLRRQGKTWQVLVQLPVQDKPSAAQLDLKLWVPYRNEPSLVKELLHDK
jgi:mono/diheme cytochrome c family protein